MNADEEKRGQSHQYHGYSTFAKWMASSNDFFLLRRFSVVTARSLLYLQHRIAKIERDLEYWDEYSKNEPVGKCSLDSIDYDELPERKILIDEITPLLQQYCA